MVHVRDIFGQVVETHPIKRTRTRQIEKPVESSSRFVDTPVWTKIDSVVLKLMNLSHNRMFADPKKDETEILRRISKIQDNKNSILKQVERHLQGHPNYGVIQSIDLITGEEYRLWD